MKAKYKLIFTWVVLIAIIAAVLFPFARTAWVVREAKQVVAHDFIDPSSATFRDIYVSPGAICGEVNAKNRMGAYVGFKLFFFDRQTRKSEVYANREPGIDEDPDMAIVANYRAMEEWYERHSEICYGD